MTMYILGVGVSFILAIGGALTNDLPMYLCASIATILGASEALRDYKAWRK